MKVLNNGQFTVTLDSSKLTKGIRTHENQPSNSEGFITLAGVIGKDGVLQRSLIEYSRIPAGGSGNFPFPQFFRLEKHIICCNETSIAEYNDDSGWVTQISGLYGLGVFPWFVASSYDWIYLSNGLLTVVRNPETNTYSLDSSAPTAFGICNYNGQIVIGYQELIS